MIAAAKTKVQVWRHYAHLQLGGEGWNTWDTPPAKPKWMRCRTYERKYECWESAVEKADEEFTIRAARLLKWM